MARAKVAVAAKDERHRLTDAMGRLNIALGMICGLEAELIGAVGRIESVREDALWLVRYADRPDETMVERGQRCAQAILSALEWLGPERGPVE